MSNEYIQIERSLGLQGQIESVGAKNAVLVIMASLILTHGKSKLKNVPRSADVLHMIKALQDLGAQIVFHEKEHTLEVETTSIKNYKVTTEIMKKMRY